MIVSLVFALVGLLFLAIGRAVWKKERIELLQVYHRNRVREEDKKSFCALCGMGVGVIGIGMLLTAGIFAVTGQLWSMAAFAVGFLMGLAMLVWAIRKYNR